MKKIESYEKKKNLLLSVRENTQHKLRFIVNGIAVILTVEEQFLFVVIQLFGHTFSLNV